MLSQEPIQGFLLTYGQFTGLDAGVVDTKEGIDIIHGLGTDVRKFFDLGCRILDLCGIGV